MKLTKVNRVRIAVAKEKDSNNGGRVILYPTPNETGRVMSIDDQIQRRVEHANRQYSVFHMPELPRDIETHFYQLVRIAKYAKTEEQMYQRLRTYWGYEKSVIAKCNAQATGKTLKMELERHVRERMTDTWQKKEYTNAAIAILQCVCDGQHFRANIEALKESQSGVFADFYAAGQECGSVDNGRPYVFSSFGLESNFSLLMKGLVAQLSRDDFEVYRQEDNGQREDLLKKQIAWLKTVKQLEHKKRNKATGQEEIKVIDLNQFSYGFAQTERLQAITVRMRKSLKWGENKRIAILLMQGLARMEGKDLSSVVALLEQEEPESLMSFIDAVNRDYYRFNIAKSVRNIDVKVQVYEDEKEPGRKQLRLSSSENGKRAALTRTMERYATSKEQSYEVLRTIKRIIFDYFLETDYQEEYFFEHNLWKFPVGEDQFFDADFEEKEDNSIRKVSVGLQELWEKNSSNQEQAANIKKRIGYVNYGKYCRMIALLREKPENEDTAFEIYWITYIKEHIEKEYVKAKGFPHKEECYRTAMARRCWKSITQFICGKYIDLGKAVFHFAMPEDMRVSGEEEKAYGIIRDEYADGISSFSYEAIKAEEMLQRNIANATVCAVSNFTKAVMDTKKVQNSKEKDLEDILFLKDDALKNFSKLSVKKQILRYYGGISSIPMQSEMDSFELVKELQQHLKEIRNENFHYGMGRQKEVSCKYTYMLWNHDVEAYRQVTRKKYYTNNVSMFYKKDDIRQLVETLYRNNATTPAQIPSFQNIWKRKDLPEYIDTLSLEWNKEDKCQVQYEGALYFILKEIYYLAFIVDERAGEYFLKAVDDYVQNEAKDKSLRPANNFKAYIETIKRNTQGELTFAMICQMIRREYNHQNANNSDGETYAHFKMLLPLCIKKGLIKYIEDNFSFLVTPGYYENETDVHYLDEIAIGGLMEECEEKTNMASERKYLWYTFAHFISPTALNFLIGDFKGYIQYREDILKRAGYAGQLRNDKEQEQEESIVRQGVERAKEILEVLEFVRGVAGRISNVFLDYYGTDEQDEKTAKEEYAKYLEQYIDFAGVGGDSAYERLQNYCYHTLLDGTTIDIYADNNNPKLLRNVELSRMYAGENLVRTYGAEDLAGMDAEAVSKLKGYRKITQEDIREYYDKKDEVAQILSNGLCKDEDEQKKVVRLQNLRNRITLNEITEIYSVVNEMLGYLVSVAYLRERDEMYLLLGFYYMALQAGDQWNEGLNTLEGKISEGFVLYQVVSVFDFGLPLLRKNESKVGGQVSAKIVPFSNQHAESLKCALALFEANSKKVSDVRNYVDHFKYYVDHKKSILDLYSEYYTRFFGYSSKLTSAVYNAFLNILARRQIVAELETVKEKKTIKLKLVGDLTGNLFPYKLQDNKEAKIQGLSESFLKSLQQVLEYKEKK